MPQPASRLDAKYRWSGKDPLLPGLRGITSDVEQRFIALEAQRSEFDAATEEVRSLGLARINDILGPAVERMVALTELGFLVAPSAFSVLLEVDTDKLWVIDEGPQRDLFSPTAFVAITRTSTVDDYAIARVLTYNHVTGELDVHIDAVFGDPGPHTDWLISAVAAGTLTSISKAVAAATSAATAVDAAVVTVADRIAVAADKVIVAGDRVTVSTLRGQTNEARDAAVVAQGAAEAAQAAAENIADVLDPEGLADQIEALQTGKAPKADATFTGAPVVIPAPLANSNTFEAANTAWVRTYLATFLAGAPEALNTLDELAAALQDNPNIITELLANIGGRVPGSRAITTTGLLAGGGDLSTNRAFDVAKATQEFAEAGVNDATAMTPLRTLQAITKFSALRGALDGQDAVTGNYSFVTADGGRLKRVTAGSAATLTVPQEGGTFLPWANWYAEFGWYGTGQPALAGGAITGGGNVLVNSYLNYKKIRARYIIVGFLRVAPNEYWLTGDLAA